MRNVFKWLAILGVWSSQAATRLATTSPDSMQFLAQLGLGNQVVASVQPEVLAAPYNTLPSLGSLYLPSVERLLSLRVDEVVIDLSLHQTLFRESVRRLGIAATELHITDLNSLISEAQRLSAKFGGAPAEKLKSCSLALADLKPTPTFSFLLLAWTNPAMAFADNTLLSDILSALGGKNIVPKKWKQSYPQLSVEWLINHKPDRVYVVAYESTDLAQARKDVQHWWPHATNIELIALDANTFSHANYAPLNDLNALRLKANTLPGDC